MSMTSSTHYVLTSRLTIQMLALAFKLQVDAHLALFVDENAASDKVKNVQGGPKKLDSKLQNA